MRKLPAIGIGAAIGGVAAYLVKRSERAGRVLGARVYGMVTRPGDVDDVTLTRKVESELFGSGGAPRDRVSVNTANGVVQLRGEVDSGDLIEDLVGRARSVEGVREVENLLHTPGSDAPMHQ
jgi:osmotically-inducible protein OsmY